MPALSPRPAIGYRCWRARGRDNEIVDTYFAVAAPGTEDCTRQELLALGLTVVDDGASKATARAGGVAFRGDVAALYRANLELRTSTRVLARVGSFFYATSLPDLRSKAARLPFERFLVPGRPIQLRASCSRSRLQRPRAIADAIVAAIAARLGTPSPVAQRQDRDPGQSESDAQLIVVRVADDQCTVSVDASGTPLYQRGYRKAVGKAPLRENLAAAMLLAAGWDPTAPLVDPFCGSGTIAIEAAMLARDLAPGANRRFAFMSWPGFDVELWQRVHAAPRTPRCPSPLILASDRDAGAVRMAGENAARAGVQDHVRPLCHALSAVEPPKSSTGWLITNPPYGKRIGAGGDLRNLYAQLGNVLRAKFRGWQVAVLCTDPMLLGQIGIRFESSAPLAHGGMRVRLARARVDQ